MIEEIVRPDTIMYALIAMFFGFTSSVVLICHGIATDNKKVHDAMIITGIIIFALSITVMITGESEYDEWIEQVDMQIDSLDCSEFEEAYNIYGFESIKEKYRSKCIDVKEEWWK